MKKLTLLSLLLLTFFIGKGQTPKQDTTKPKYNYFALVPFSDYQQLAQIVSEYKRLQMYDPNTTDAQKVALSKGIDAYLRGLPGRVKLDSVKVKPVVIGKP